MTEQMEVSRGHFVDGGPDMSGGETQIDSHMQCRCRRVSMEPRPEPEGSMATREV